MQGLLKRTLSYFCSTFDLYDRLDLKLSTCVQVNNQMVVGTLMNICDAPNQVSIGQTWREGDWVKRIPIIVTGNDFSRVFAPLVREGRMAKFYWSPAKEELMAILHQMYKVCYL